MLSVYTWLNYYKLAVVERAEPVVRFHSGGSNAGLLCACEPLRKRLVCLKASGLRVRCSSLQVWDDSGSRTGGVAT